MALDVELHIDNGKDPIYENSFLYRKWLGIKKAGKVFPAFKQYSAILTTIKKFGGD